MGALIVIAVIAPWYVMIYAAHGWTYIASFFLRDNLGRFATEDFGPTRGFLFYVPAYVTDFFPWSLLTPWTLYCLWKSRKEAAGLACFSSDFPLVWCGFVFLFFSLARNKQEYYIAALYPMMAVMIGAVLEHATKTIFPQWQRAVKLLKWSYSVISAALLILSVLLFFAVRSFLPQLPVVLRSLPAIILFSTFLVLAWSVVRGKHFECFTTLSVSLLALFICASAVYLPAMEAFRPVKELCQEISLQSQPDDEAGYFRAAVPSMVYYLRRPIFEEYDADGMVHRFQSPRRVLCVMTKPDYDYLVGSRHLTLYLWDHRLRLVTRLRGLLERNRAGDQELLLVSNRPKPEKGGRISQ
jgi:4-amino-4-deoxy-L-arabinose transferase-like glycosyltransferase